MYVIYKYPIDILGIENFHIFESAGWETDFRMVLPIFEVRDKNEIITSE
jgi:hypothetical protein